MFLRGLIIYSKEMYMGRLKKLCPILIPGIASIIIISIIIVVDGFFKEFGETPWGHNEYRIISGKGIL